MMDKNSTIPKIIHYCWFGKQEKSPLILECIETWKKLLPEYKVYEWNEDNSQFDCEFAKRSFENKKWAFLSDYIRLKVLSEYGGVYLDTDMFFLKPLESLLQNKCFLGYQANGQIAAGIIGCVPQHPFIVACTTRYRNMFFDEHRLMNMAIPKIITEAYTEYQDKDSVYIYPFQYFYAYVFEDSLRGIDFHTSIKSDTVAVHLWNASWFTKKERAGFAFADKKYFQASKLLFEYMLENPKFIIGLPMTVLRYFNRKGE
jgi:mannosyltransferase OCH1-like enzyme